MKSTATHSFVNSCLVLFVLYFAGVWVFKLEVLPGLHGDEAWSGNKALHFGQQGIDQIQGMNNYTGVLQAIVSSFAFKLLGVNVYALRISGALFNLLGVLIFCYTLIKCNYKIQVVTFLGILSQSVLYLTAPRVAWEVNTFTLFLSSLLLISVVHIFSQPHRKNSPWLLVFLTINIIGTYNHIIFSSISLSCLIGLLLWINYFKSDKYQTFILILFINIANISATFLAFRYFAATLQHNLWIFPVLLIMVLTMDMILYHRFYKCSYVINFNSKRSQFVIGCILIVCVSTFMFFHGRAFFEVLTGYKIFLQNYSYDCSIVLKAIFISCGIVFAGYLIYFMILDLGKQTTALHVFLIISYLGIINFYTVSTSFRYYLITYIFIAIYMSVKIKPNIKSHRYLIGSLIISFIIINSVQLDIFINNRPIKAVKFNIGNGKEETSAHFLPKMPVIDFLRKNNVGQLLYLNDHSYFLVEPIQFYIQMKPWMKNPKVTAAVGYDYNVNGNGFNIYIDPE